MAFSMKSKIDAISKSFRNGAAFCFNPRDKTVLGRNGMSWAKIGLFYLIFYTCLAAFWATCFYIVMYFISGEEPFVVKYKTPLQLVPGMTRVPRGNKNLFSYNLQEYKKLPREQLPYIQELDSFFFPNVTDIPIDKLHVHPKCDSKYAVKGGKYGYDEGKPIIVLKLNKVYFFDASNATTFDISCRTKLSKEDEDKVTYKICPSETEEQVSKDPKEYVKSKSHVGYRTQFVYVEVDVTKFYNEKFRLECKYDFDGRFQARYEDNFGATTFLIKVTDDGITGSDEL